MAADPWTHALEWRIAWRHLRVGERHPRWVDALTLVSVFLLVVGLAFVGWAAHLGPSPEPGEQLFSAALATAQQRQYGVFGGASIAMGVMLLVLAILARFFNLLATIITESVLLGCMALVVVLSLMSGLEADLRDKILNQKAHLRVSSSDGNRFTDYESLVSALDDLPEVAGASPYLEAEVMVRSGINRQGAVLLGVEPERLNLVSNLAEIISEGSFDSLAHPETIADPDPFATTDPQTPWRLRHLDKAEVQVGEKVGLTGALAPAKPAVKIDRALPDTLPDTLPDVDDDDEGADTEQDPDAADPEPRVGAGVGLNTGRLPPPTELFGGPGSGEPFAGPFGRSGLPKPFAGGDDGWEDPVEVLGLDEEPAAARAPSAVAPIPPGDDVGVDEVEADGGDDGWEDPVEVLDISEEGSEDGSEDAPATPPTPAIALKPEPESEPRQEGIVDPILIGRELANELAVGVGARVQLITPVGRLTPAGRVPGILAAKVGGVFHSGMYEYDRKNVYTPLPVAQAFLRTGDRVSGIEVKLHEIDRVDAGKLAVEAKLRELGRSAPLLRRTVTRLVNSISDVALREQVAATQGISLGESELIVESWKELNRNLFSAMFLEKIAMFVALMFVVLVASFGILASNLMSVLEKSKEIAILKAMGSPDHLIQRVFVAEGLCLGVLGAMGGISVGLALCWALDRFGFPFNENVYYIERLPVVVNPVEVGVVGVAALVIVFLSSLYPARVASRMRPVDGLRHQEK
ncbi:FtsX-like permease family protein [Enhygromyxa salina]|uniref:Lipoprotein-releasing system transmembrane protein LolE n=1 Tax=Enhygromyxa salina TaxID=215803 RepID=A0A2S9YR20_9BACT|nr:FtsX-like permease family protein [Enhygromyxa salina]PRQ07509.1 Lipoprotein-releasing system transmembrane protein LolE [Enhygromyxa salina]